MLFKAAILSTLLSVGSEAGTSNSENNLAQAIRQGASQSFNQVGEQVVGRSLNVQPTITIRPGFPVRVMVTHDLVLEPYRAEEDAMAKLKLGAIPDDKPVKLTIELPARFIATSSPMASARPRNRPGRRRAGKADRADVGALHGDRPRLRQTARTQIRHAPHSEKSAQKS